MLAVLSTPLPGRVQHEPLSVAQQGAMALLPSLLPFPSAPGCPNPDPLTFGQVELVCCRKS